LLLLLQGFEVLLLNHLFSLNFSLVLDFLFLFKLFFEELGSLLLFNFQLLLQFKFLHMLLLQSHFVVGFIFLSLFLSG